MADRTCVHEHCERTHYGRGYCRPCYMKIYNAGGFTAPVVPWSPPRTAPTVPPRFGSDRLPERFWRRVELADNGCWLWNGLTSRLGYGLIHVNPIEVATHKLAYQVLVGEVGEGLELDHLCHTSALNECVADGAECIHRRCCNPDHLEPVTHEENMRRARREFCRSGQHRLRGANLIPSSDGRRRCRACSASKQNARRRERRRAPRANLEQP